MCNCGMVRDGAFVLVAALWAAMFSSAFCGASFGTLLIQTWHAPGNAPNALIIWVIVFAIGCIRFGLGVHRAMADGDTASIPASLFGMGVPLLALYKGWLPYAEDVGLASHLAWEGFYVAFFGAALSNLWLALSARQRRRRLLRPLAPAYDPQLAMEGLSGVPAGLAPPRAAWPMEPLLGIDNTRFHRTLAQLRALAPAERMQLLEAFVTKTVAPAEQAEMAWPPAMGGY